MSLSNGLGYNLGMQNNRVQRKKMLIAASFILVSIAACQGKNGIHDERQQTDTATLIPYHSATPTPVLSTPTPPEPTSPPLPSPTPTYRVHLVKKGDDLSGIAYLYQVTLTDLLSANPDVNPYAMSVGISLNIPPASVSANDDEIQPTPVGVQIEQPVCFRSEAKGTWCFSEVFNPLPHRVENVSAILRIQTQGQENQQSYTMFSGLNTIPAEGSMPLLAYIPDEIGDHFNTAVELNSALPLRDDSERYLPVSLQDVNIQTISRATANAVGQVRLSEQSSGAAGEVWILAVAYNADHQIIGVRRYEMRVQMEPGTQLPFNFDVYVAGGSISRVELSVEAMP